jgi:hypothetical protein
LSKENPSLDVLGLGGPASAKVPCPSCLQTIQYPLTQAGTAKCPGCKHSFTLPTVAPISTNNELIAEPTPVRQAATSAHAMRYAKSQLPKSRRINVAFWLTACFIGIPFVFVIYACSGVGSPPSSVDEGQVRRDKMKAVVDFWENEAGSTVFGNTKSEGRHLIVTLEDGYFSMDATSQRLSVTEVHKTWVTVCHGNKSTFKRWNGSVVAELEK